MFVSAIFMLLAFIAGVCIAGSIRSCENDANVKYYQAVKIADSTQFNYAFKTNAGHTLAYGTVAAVGYVTDEGIGNYMTLTRVLEEYRKHHRTVCSGEGKPFKLICNDDGTFSVWHGAMTLNIEEYPNLLADTAKDMKHNGWYPMFYRFMRGG